MGGKKRTKWRKLPLAEFTKECSEPPAVSKNECKQDVSNDEEIPPPMPSYDVRTNQYNEFGDYTNVPNMVYPTYYLVYNPMEMPFYPSYVIPPDACYYYVPSEIPAVPVVYNDYIPQVKDSASVTRPFNHSRRYNGYAEYAVIPEKTSREKEDRPRRPGSYINASRNDNRPSRPKTMTSFSETSREGHKRVQEHNEKKLIVPKTQNVGISQVERSENLHDVQNLRKKQEICGVHGAQEKENFQNVSEVSFHGEKSKLKYSQEGEPNTKKLKNFPKQIQENEDNQKYQDTANPPRVVKEKKEIKNSNHITGYSLHSSARDTAETISTPNSDSVVITTLQKANDNVYHQNKTEKHIEKESSSPLPDILHETMSAKPKTTSSRNNDRQSEGDKTPPPNERFSKPYLSHSPYVPHSINFDLSSHDDTESELKSLTNLQSSIYKLAYDENVTDQSEADSRSPSPVDPETQVPRSIINDEILIHENDSCSEAGSEDVELIPHRYESETFLNESKHMYVNKLSLAVELLRTQESLPYDEQFKRVSGESNSGAVGKVNSGFVDDSPLFDSFESDVVTSQSQTRKNSGNRAIVSSFSLEDTCEEAKEEIAETADAQDNSEGVRAGYRRFQVQFRHYLTPRAALVNPCLCCVIM